MSFTSSASEWAPLTLNQPPTTPPMPSPTSAPKTTPTTPTKPLAKMPERRAKLRASCDACAASKVKCSKQHPICTRCAANGSQCIYGVSRKHGKPGRTRKRNPDGTPFIKQSKQRPSPNGSEFSKFRIRAEPLIPDVPEIETASWPSTPSWPPTPEFEYEMTPEPMFSEPEFNFMDDMLMASPPQTYEEASQTIEPVLTFRDPFAKSKSSMHQDIALPTEFQVLQEFIGGKSVNPADHSIQETIVDSYFSDWSDSEQQTPDQIDAFFMKRASVAVPAQHRCYNIAYSTLESLQSRTPTGEQGSMPDNIEMKNLDSVLSVTKAAIQNVVQLLACPCSSDPHLAMLYSSIASKILAWYQIAAKEVSAHTPDHYSSPSLSSSSTFSSPALSSSTFSSTFSSPALSQGGFSDFSSPLPTPSPTNTAFNIKPVPIKIGMFEFDESVQETLRRQVVLRELKKSSAMIDALANWSGEGASEQAEFLYDVLGAWLKSELYKTLREVEGVEE
ncbi:hypothetical protein K504DRAFT_458695 [Pleomassaria siparia CBS 279.74]|uniref:Zn(2)-C6 fungal-type domain-containing protein n=1 Tax=Pleomassaria siparia CBS 279.74 TaxID=1314801 RepID=A0A6G1K411_9PLEO|nr:hypothetical protein K504DRAFT_458695 [Pleomassaria siparia CBS 279.74]